MTVNLRPLFETIAVRKTDGKTMVLTRLELSDAYKNMPRGVAPNRTPSLTSEV